MLGIGLGVYARMMELKNKRILVTGSRGFIGRHLLKALKKHNKVYEIPSKPSLYVPHQFSDFDIVYHLGAQTLVGKGYSDPLETFEKNIKGTWELLEVCRKAKVKRMVIASSDKVYGEGLWQNETNALNGKGIYDVSKVCLDNIAQAYIENYGMNIAITRFVNIFGPGDLKFSRLIPDTITSILRKQRPIIRSNGKSWRDYVYIKDVIEVYLMLGNNNKSGVFNFGCNNPLRVIEVVNLISKLMNSRLKPKILNIAKNEVYAQCVISQKAKEELGWTPKYNLEKGLKETIKWYQNEKNKSWK